jgi:primase-polymerase (primpol)-like protein
MIRVENIPVELKAERAWCWWKYEKRNGKPAKVPCTADGTPIDVASAHPVVFSFDAVMEAVKEGFGAGYIFLPENRKTGIDLDHCIEQGRISAPAQEIIRELDSYSEISPSGTGVHILARGKLPGPRRKKDRIEMYDAGRYFTVTGNVLEGGPTTVNDRQDQLGALYHKIFPDSPQPDQPSDEQSKHFSRWQAIPDAEIIRLLCSMAGYFKLWNGNIEEQAGDQSAADFKLCCRLAYYTGRDRERIDRLFRQSKLMRPKWNEKRGAQTYGQLTVIKAVAKQIEVWEPVPRVELFDTFESFENAKPPSYAIEGFLPHEGATGIAGLSGHSKTLMMLAMAKAQFMGPPHKLWGLFPVTERVEKIIYLIPECGRSYFKQRLKLF